MSRPAPTRADVLHAFRRRNRLAGLLRSTILPVPLSDYGSVVLRAFDLAKEYGLPPDVAAAGIRCRDLADYILTHHRHEETWACESCGRSHTNEFSTTCRACDRRRESGE